MNFESSLKCKTVECIIKFNTNQPLFHYIKESNPIIRGIIDSTPAVVMSNQGGAGEVVANVLNLGRYTNKYDWFL